MRVLLVANYAPDAQYSMLGFRDCLMRELPRLGLSVDQLAPEPKFGNLSRTSRTKKWLAYLDKFVLFPSKLRRVADRYDLVHILDHGNSMYVRKLPQRHRLVTCHDMLAIRASRGEISGWNVRASGRKLQTLILEGLKLCESIACVSRATQSDVVRLAGKSVEEAPLILNGMYQLLPEMSEHDAATWLGKLGVSPPYYMHVGGDAPYKNRIGAVKIYEALVKSGLKPTPTLVLAGRPPEGATRDAIDQLESASVVVLESPSAEVLSALYSIAEGFIFPSNAEGFGLPILEAQSMGCPVYTSNLAPMTEVGGEGATYFDPASPEQAARAILGSASRREELRRLGRENASLFTAERMANEYADLYRRVLCA